MDIVAIDYLLLRMAIFIFKLGKCSKEGFTLNSGHWGNSNFCVLCELSFYSLKIYFLKAHHYMHKGIIL